MTQVRQVQQAQRRPSLARAARLVRQVLLVRQVRRQQSPVRQGRTVQQDRLARLAHLVLKDCKVLQVQVSQDRQVRQELKVHKESQAQLRQLLAQQVRKVHLALPDPLARQAQRQQLLVRKASLDRQVQLDRKVQHLTSQVQRDRKDRQVRKDSRPMSQDLQARSVQLDLQAQQVQGSTISRLQSLRHRARSARATLASLSRSTLRLRSSSQFLPTQRTTLQWAHSL